MQRADERIRREKEFLEPFADFKGKVNEIIKILEVPIASIDAQVKEVEECEKRDKRNSCFDIFLGTDHPEWLSYEDIENQKWYNKSSSMKAIEEEILAKIKHHTDEYEAIGNYSASPFEAQEYYKQTLDFAKAMAEGQRVVDVAKAKAKLVDDMEADETHLWVSFEAFVTPRKAKMLNSWCKLNGIMIRKPGEE